MGPFCRSPPWAHFFEQGDASVFTLGGVSEPMGTLPGVRTRGGEALALLNETVSAAAFVGAACALSKRSFWRGGSNDFNWSQHATCPRPNVLPNLWLIPGGKRLHGLDFQKLAPALKLAFSLMPNTIVIIDTDAELSERGASLAAVAASDELALVVSASWTDYLRTIDDPANSLFRALDVLVDYKPLISRVIFNSIQKRAHAPCPLLGVEKALAFTPPSTSLEAISEITTHLFSIMNDPATNYARYFKMQVANASLFTKSYVSAICAIPESAWQDSWKHGEPVALMDDPNALQFHRLAQDLTK